MELEQFFLTHLAIHRRDGFLALKINRQRRWGHQFRIGISSYFGWSISPGNMERSHFVLSLTTCNWRRMNVPQARQCAPYIFELPPAL
jgi:hypothetical protein